jgi:hypothetical protein
LRSDEPAGQVFDGLPWPKILRIEDREEKPMRSLLNARNLVLRSALLALLCGAAAAQVQVPVSGYEIYLGHNCRVAGVSGTCGATFTGWTGVTADGGWVGFPGSGQGVWSIQINYTGKPAFGGSVNIVGGRWSFLFFNGLDLHGKVVSGTVTWPADANTSIGCGNGVAVGQASLTVAGGRPATVTGCLHDLPAGKVIPPTIWGVFNF